MSNTTTINYCITFLQSVDIVQPLIGFHLNSSLISLFHLSILTHHISNL